MKTFRSLDDFAAHLGTLRPKLERAQRAALQRVSAEIKRDAQAQLGHYQGAVGPLPAWPELAESTKADRARAGFPANEPLKRTGALGRSIHYATRINRAVIGSTSDVAVTHEQGEGRVPARPFLGGAAFRHAEGAAERVAQAVVDAFADRPTDAAGEGEDQ